MKKIVNKFFLTLFIVPIVICTIILLPIAGQSANKQTIITINYSEQINDFAQIYFDMGRGYNEEDSVRGEIVQKVAKINVGERFENPKSIRIDFTNNSKKVGVSSIQLGKDSKEELESLELIELLGESVNIKNVSNKENQLIIDAEAVDIQYMVNSTFIALFDDSFEGDYSFLLSKSGICFAMLSIYYLTVIIFLNKEKIKSRILLKLHRSNRLIENDANKVTNMLFFKIGSKLGVIIKKVEGMKIKNILCCVCTISIIISGVICYNIYFKSEIGLAQDHINGWTGIQWLGEENVKQVFKAETDTISGFSLNFGSTYKTPTAGVDIYLTNVSSGEQYYHGSVPKHEILQFHQIKFRLDKPVEDIKGELISIQISATGNNTIPAGLTLNSCSEEDNILYVGDEIVEDVALKFMVFSPYSLSQIFVIELFLLLFLVMFAVQILMYYIIFIKQKCKQKIILVCIIIIGLLYSIIIPPFSSPDENSHYWRAYGISQMKLFPESTDDENIMVSARNTDIEFVSRFQFPFTSYGQLEEELFNNTKNTISNIGTRADMAAYFPIGYLPQVFGLKIGNALNLNGAITYYLCRILSLIVFAISIFWISGKLKNAQALLLCISVSPMILHQVVSFNFDMTIFLLALIYVVYIYSIASEKRPMSINEMIQLMIIGGILAVCKSAYVPIVCILPLALCRKNLKSMDNFKILCLIGSGSLSCVLWSNTMMKYMKFVDMEGALASVFNNFFDTIAAFFINAWNQAYFLFFTMMGGSLSWFTIFIGSSAVIMFSIPIVASIIFNNEEDGVHGLTFLQSGLFIITFACVCELLFVVFGNGIGAPFGLQGRYFIPALIVLCFGMCIKCKNYYIIDIFRPISIYMIYANFVILSRCIIELSQIQY